MSFSSRRYDSQVNGALIFGIQTAHVPDPKAWMPIIPNIRPRRTLKQYTA